MSSSDGTSSQVVTNALQSYVHLLQAISKLPAEILHFAILSSDFVVTKVINPGSYLKWSVQYSLSRLTSIRLASAMYLFALASTERCHGCS